RERQLGELAALVTGGPAGKMLVGGDRRIVAAREQRGRRGCNGGDEKRGDLSARSCLVHFHRGHGIAFQSRRRPSSQSVTAAESMFTPLQGASNWTISSRQSRNVPCRATTRPCACSRTTANAADTTRIG